MKADFYQKTSLSIFLFEPVTKCFLGSALWDGTFSNFPFPILASLLAAYFWISHCRVPVEAQEVLQFFTISIWEQFSWQKQSLRPLIIKCLV